MKKNNTKKSAIPKNTQLYAILRGITMEDINATRGKNSEIRIEVNPAATKIEEVGVGK
jgi:hypothetical protein